MRIPTAVSLFALSLPFAAGLPAQSVRGVPNYQQLNESVSRGGQPDEEGFRNLAASGVRTIVDLRESGDRAKWEKHLVHELGMHYVNIPMRGMHTPRDKDVSHALRELKAGRGPVFIHCQRGADRTGVVLACYRMEHDRWTNRQALDEARSLGLSWYQFPLIRYVQSYRPHSSGGLDGVADSIKDLPRRVTGLFDR